MCSSRDRRWEDSTALWSGWKGCFGNDFEDVELKVVRCRKGQLILRVIIASRYTLASNACLVRAWHEGSLAKSSQRAFLVKRTHRLGMAEAVNKTISAAADHGLVTRGSSGWVLEIDARWQVAGRFVFFWPLRGLLLGVR